MAVLQSICASYMSSSREIADFRAGLAAVTKEFDDGLHAIEKSIDLSSLSTQIDNTLATLDKFYGAVPGAASTALKAQGIPGTDLESAHRVLEDRGFLYAGSRYWKCNSQTITRPGRQVSGVGAGYGDGPAVASELLGVTVTDPATAVVSGMLVRAQGAASVAANSASSTGPRNRHGNIDDLRELARGCGSMAALRAFLETSHVRGIGFGIVYSTATTSYYPRPADVRRSDFVTWLRNTVQTPLFADDIMLDETGDAAYVRVESPLGYSWEPFEVVKQRQLVLAHDLQRPVSSLPVIRRTVRFIGNETVTGSAPVIRSRGCDALKLKADRFTIGLSVNGIYRVIDVTGDRGSFTIRGTYSTIDIVTSINKVFGDLVLCGVSGTEFWIRLRDGFGANGTLSLFWSGDTDCSGLLGLENAIADAFETHATTTRRTTAISLKERKEVTWHGGAASETGSAPATMLAALRVDGALTEPQATALLTGSDYWSMLSTADSITQTSTKLAAVCNSNITVTQITDIVTDAIAAYESELVFADVTDTGYFEAEMLFGGLGVTDIDNVLRNKQWIWSVDPYQTEADVLSEMQAVLAELSASSGIMSASTDWLQITQPLPTNYAVAAQLRLRHDIAKYLRNDVDADFDLTPAQQAASFCAYATAVTGTVQTNTTATKANTSDQSGTMLIAGFNTTAAVQTNAAQVDLTHLIWDVLSTDVQDKLIAYAVGKAQGYLDAGVSVVEDVAGVVADEIADTLRSIADFVGDLLGDFSLSAAQRKALAALLKANEALLTAQGFVQRMQARYNSLMQQAESLSNFAINFSGSLGFKTKFVTCTATGSVSAVQLQLLAQFLGLINKLAEKLNKLLKSLHDLLEHALDKVVCALDKIMAGLTGTIQYESTIQLGAVTASLQCTATVSLSTDFDPNVLLQITTLRDRVLCLLDSMKLQLVAFKAHTANIDATSSAFSGTLADTLERLLSSFMKC